MESTKAEIATSAMRLRLILGKFQIVKIQDGMAHVNLGHGVTMQIKLLPAMDVRPGDILTYYTEVPFNAHTYPTSEQ